MRMIPFFLLLVLLGGNKLEKRPQKTVSTPRFVISDEPPIAIKPTQSYVFGYLEVPENRALSNSQTIRLPVYIFKSRNPEPQPDPVIYTVGGPGYTSLRSAPYMDYYRYLDDRDLILFEQRGNRYAEPHLGCPEWAEAQYQANLPQTGAEQGDSLLLAAASACRMRLLAEGIDLNGYNTEESAADIVDLVRVLDLPAYNLLTISYSTKIAQVIMRDYPAKLRSVVMDSPLPLEVNYDEESVANLLLATRQLLADCMSDPTCHAAYPGLEERFFQFLQEITDNPLEIKVRNPHSRKKEIFFLRGKDLMGILAQASTSEVAAIPLEIDKILQGNYRSLKEQLANLFVGPGSGDGMGMRLSVWCAEEYPFASQSVIQQETNRYPFCRGLSPAVFDSSICGIWGVQPAATSENLPVSSEIPLLLISGEYDSQTPPHWAAAMQKNFPNSYHLVFRAWLHTPTTNWGNPCGMQVAQAFFNAPHEAPVLPCFEQLTAPDFIRK